MVQRRGNAIGQERRGEIVEHRAEHELGLVGAAALEHRHAAEALQHLVEPALVAERALIAITGQPGIDQARVDPSEARIVDAEPGRHRGAEILDQHIGALDQPMQHRETFLLLQIEREGALAAVRAEKEPRLARQAGGKLAQHVALRRLDLDHIGAEVR